MTKPNKFDFSGYLTRYNVKCTDGRIIQKDAFKHSDGAKIPLVWVHTHDEPSNILGHLILEHRDDGVYSYGIFNGTKSGQEGKILVEHGDIDSLSVYANDLVEKPSKSVIHGEIREGSLVLAGANPGAKIDFVSIVHGDGTVVELEDEAIIYLGTIDREEKEEKEEKKDPPANPEVIKHAEGVNEKTVKEVFDTMTEEQKTVVYAVVSEVMKGTSEEEESEENLEQSNLNNEGEGKIMKHNVFEGKQATPRPTLTREQFQTIMADALQMGSMKQSFLKHAGTYGIDNIDVLFPDAQSVMDEPFLYSRDMAWVDGVIAGTRHTPFSRIKSAYADITVETARALGYVTGALKKEEVFALLTRTTLPTTIYKKQKLDRDDIIDITDLDVVAWMKREMRMMLNEEIARAILISDGRDPVAQAADKIVETCVRPIWKDDDMYAHKVQMLLADTTAEIIDKVILGRINYKGSGSPNLYTSTTWLTNMLLLKDTQGYRIYKTEAELASALRVNRIVEVPLMENLTREAGVTDYKLLGIIVNLKDYVVGADRGGQISMFDDFDIDYNQFKYLMETRMSGALVIPKAALVVEQATT